jgi:S1-C subfamily serine protease
MWLPTASAPAIGALAAAFALALFASGCAGQAEEPPEAEPAITVPELERVASGVPAAVRARTPVLARDSAERKARALTVRVRNVSCEGVGTGSGFALSDHVLITNRHVLTGADSLEVSTWDGKTFTVGTARVGVLGDLGVAVVGGTLPRAGEYGPAPKQRDRITVVGYPRGGPLTLSEGTVIDRVDGAEFDVEGTVVRLTATVVPGNSGGPVLDAKGRVVAIVYAIEIATGFGLAIPVDTMRRLVGAGGYTEVPACGFE